MKVIVTCPVKNEEWVLRSTLKNFSTFADLIIIADQSSSDKTLDICKEFSKVKVIPNPFKGYTNEVRFMLLDEARKEVGEKIIVCLDADEQITASFVTEMKEHILAKKDSKTVSFYSEWLQIYNNKDTYRVDGLWENNYKTFAFLDDSSLDYERAYVTQEHIPRVPKTSYTVALKSPIIHLQFLARKRNEVKQALYMCNELTEGWDPRRTNNRYSIAKFFQDTPVKKVSAEFLKDIYYPSEEELSTFDKTKLDNIYSLFKEKGSGFFEPLDIWHLPELRNYFIEENKREPLAVKVFPKWLIFINDQKNRIKYRVYLWYTNLNIF